MLAGTGLENLCEIANSAADMKVKIKSLFDMEFDQNQIVDRIELLQKRFSDEKNAKDLVAQVFDS
jgi:hypothetical protein